VNSLPQTVTRQRRDCDLNPGPSARESSTLTTKLPSHPSVGIGRVYAMHAILPNNKCHFSVELKKLPSTEDRVQTVNARVATDYSTLLNDLTLTLALTFQSAASCGHNPYTRKSQGRRSVDSKDRVETGGRTNTTDFITLPTKAIGSKNCSAQYRTSASEHHSATSAQDIPIENCHHGRLPSDSPNPDPKTLTLNRGAVVRYGSLRRGGSVQGGNFPTPAVPCCWQWRN